MNLYIKRAIRITVFAAVFLMVFLYLNSLFLTQWDNRDNGVERMETLLSFPEKSSDVLFLGSSGVLTGISPARIWENNKISSYNLSTSLHSFFVRYFKLKQILKTKNINLVVLDLSYLFNAFDDTNFEKHEPTHKQGFNSMTDISMKYEYLSTLKQEFDGINRAHYLLPILKHHNNWDQLNSRNIESKEESFKLGTRLDKRVRKITFSEHEKDKDFNEYELKYFKKILELCENENVSVLGILTPKSKDNKTEEAKLIKLSNENGFDFINFGNADHSKKIGLSYEEDFYDTGHLNTLGNRKLSDYIGNFISDNYTNIKIWQKSDIGYDEQTKIWQEAELEYNKFYEDFLLELADKK